MAPADFHLYKLGPEDDSRSFDCSQDDINDFIKNDAIAYQNNSIAATYVVKESNKIIAFISLAMGYIQPRKEMRIHGVKVDHYPGLLIGQLGVDTEHQGGNIGTDLLKFSIQKARELENIVGCNVVYLDSYPGMTDWYEERGFTYLHRSGETVRLVAKVF